MELFESLAFLFIFLSAVQIHVAGCVTWDLEALEFADLRLGCSLLRDLIMKIESCTVLGQPLFHTVGQTWDKNGYQFGFFPNADTEAWSMIMTGIKFDYNKRCKLQFGSYVQAHHDPSPTNTQVAFVHQLEQLVLDQLVISKAPTSSSIPTSSSTEGPVSVPHLQMLDTPTNATRSNWSSDQLGKADRQ